jgi:hypothetical protein
MKDFQERVLKKVRDDIANLLPEEAIKAMFDQALESIFFKDIPEIRDNWGNIKQGSKQSWFVQEISRQAEPIVKEYVKKHMEQFHPTIEKAIKEFLSAESLTLIAVGTMAQVSNNQMQNNIEQLAIRIADRIRHGH